MAEQRGVTLGNLSSVRVHSGRFGDIRAEVKPIPDDGPRGAEEFPATIVQDDTALTDLLGEKCPDCGWRQGHHKPGGELLGEPCLRWQE
jgi:hypothetical protein